MKERLFKKNVLNVKPFFVHVAQVLDVVILHVSFVHVSIYVAMNMFGMYMVHYTLWCQKNLEMSIEYLKRATFIIKKEVGGRELTKLWVYSLVLPSQLRFPPNVFFPNFVRGEWSKVWIDVQWWGVHPFCFAYDKRKSDKRKSNVWMREHEICSTDFPILLCEKKSEWATCIQSKKQCEHSCILAISLVAAYEMFEHIDMYICYYIFRYIYVMYI